MVNAAQISYDLTTLPSTLTDLPTNTPISGEQFNPALGTLQSVELVYTWDGSTVLTVVNNANPGGGNSTGSASTQVTVSITDPLSYIAETDFLNVPPSASKYSEFTNLAPGSHVTLGGTGCTPQPACQLTGSFTQDYTYNDSSTDGPQILSEFTGTGDVTLYLNTFTETLIGYHGGNADASQVTTVGASGEVIYTYTTIPEPGTFCLIGGALVGLSVLSRKRSRRR
jgi:hypothetical protein